MRMYCTVEATCKQRTSNKRYCNDMPTWLTISNQKNECGRKVRREGPYLRLARRRTDRWRGQSTRGRDHHRESC